MHAVRGWIVMGVVFAVAALLVPLLNALPSATSALHLPDYLVPLLGKIFVLVALILFIQRRPRGLFPQVGRAAEAQ